MQNMTHWISHYGYGGLFVLLMLGIVGVPLPDETLLTFTGFAAYQGEMHFGWALATAMAGSCFGITLSYGLGYFVGAWLIARYGHWVHLTPERIDRVDYWFDKYGKWTLTFGYFVPGFRHITAYVAGMTCMKYVRFAMFAYAGAAIWATTFLCLGYYLGPEWEKALHWVSHGHKVLLYAIPAAIVLGVAIWLLHRSWGGKGRGS